MLSVYSQAKISDTQLVSRASTQQNKDFQTQMEDGREEPFGITKYFWQNIHVFWIFKYISIYIEYIYTEFNSTEYIQYIQYIYSPLHLYTNQEPMQ